VARDSSNIISAKGNVTQSVLSLKSLMALDAATPFEIETPPVDKIPVENIAELQPESVYTLAMASMPQQIFNDYKIKAAQKNSAAAKGRLYPSVSIFGGLSSNYINSKIPVYQPTGTFSNNILSPQVTIGGTTYKVSSADFVQTGSRNIPFFTQLEQNFRQSVGLSVSVPIFNGYSARTNYFRSMISIKNQELQKEADNQSLKQNIYQAYNAAVVAMEKLNASKKTVETADRTYNFAKKRYDVGLMGTFELITNQNNLFRAKLEYAMNQFDYVFKMKVLEFYKGQGLKF
jgi:outer membrane protein